MDAARNYIEATGRGTFAYDRGNDFAVAFSYEIFQKYPSHSLEYRKRIADEVLLTVMELTTE